MFHGNEDSNTISDIDIHMTFVLDWEEGQCVRQSIKDAFNDEVDSVIAKIY